MAVQTCLSCEQQVTFMTKHFPDIKCRVQYLRSRGLEITRHIVDQLIQIEPIETLNSADIKVALVGIKALCIDLSLTRSLVVSFGWDMRHGGDGMRIQVICEYPLGGCK